jgi:hypothetical protein
MLVNPRCVQVINTGLGSSKNNTNDITQHDINDVEKPSRLADPDVRGKLSNVLS